MNVLWKIGNFGSFADDCAWFSKGGKLGGRRLSSASSASSSSSVVWECLGKWRASQRARDLERGGVHRNGYDARQPDAKRRSSRGVVAVAVPIQGVSLSEVAVFGELDLEDNLPSSRRTG